MKNINSCILRLVYYREFQNLLDGIGHKLFLEELSQRSLKRFVIIHNPQYEDLTVNAD